MRRLLSLLLAFLCAAAPSFADTLTMPYSFSPGDTVTASKFNSNFTAISSIINGNIDDNNIKVAAGIQLSKLAATSELFVLRTAANRALSAGTTGDTVPRLTMDSSGRLLFGAGSASALDVMIKRNSSTQLSIRNAADSADANLTVGALTLGTPLSAANGGTGITTATDGQTIQWSGGAWVAATAGSAWTTSAKSAGFTANDAGNTFYLITASSAIAVTLPASPADGRVYKFQRVSGSALTTLTANGAQTIRYGDAADTTLIIDSGCVELIAVTGGWVVT